MVILINCKIINIFCMIVLYYQVLILKMQYKKFLPLCQAISMGKFPGDG